MQLHWLKWPRASSDPMHTEHPWCSLKGFYFLHESKGNAVLRFIVFFNARGTCIPPIHPSRSSALHIYGFLSPILSSQQSSKVDEADSVELVQGHLESFMVKRGFEVESPHSESDTLTIKSYWSKNEKSLFERRLGSCSWVLLFKKGADL